MLIDGTKERAIRDELVTIYQAVDASYYVFDKSRFIHSKQHFEANTTFQGIDRGEIRYVQLSFLNFENIADAAQFDAECVPVRVNYELEVFAQHIGQRSDLSNSDNDYVGYLLDLGNATTDNNEIVVSGLMHKLTQMVPRQDKTDIKHEIIEVDGYRSRYGISVEVYE